MIYKRVIQSVSQEGEVEPIHWAPRAGGELGLIALFPWILRPDELEAQKGGGVPVELAVDNSYGIQKTRNWMRCL